MWNNVKLKDICKVFDDGNWIESKDQSDDGIRLIQTGNIKFGTFADRKNKARYVSEKTFKRLNCKEIFAGDILVSRLPDPVGRACIIPKLSERAITAVDCTIIRLNEICLPEYLNYFMQSPQYFIGIRKEISGATRQRISRKNLGEILIPLPPLTEQQRIVSKLDIAFAGIDRTIDATQNNLKSSKIIFSKYLKNIFQTKRAEYTNSTIGKTCTIKSGTTVKPDIERAAGKIPYLKVADMNLKGNEKEITTSSRFLNIEDIRNNSIIEPGATIFPKRGGAIATNKKRIITTQTCIDLNIMSVLPKKKIILPKLLYYYFINIDLSKLGSGSSIPQVNNYDIEPLFISFPSKIEEQDKIINKIDELYTETNKLVNIYKNKVKYLIIFKNSFLSECLNERKTKKIA